MKLSTITAVIFLALVSVAQLTRFLLRVEVSAGGTLVPVWWSLAAFLFTGDWLSGSGWKIGNNAFPFRGPPRQAPDDGPLSVVTRRPPTWRSGCPPRKG